VSKFHVFWGVVKSKLTQIEVTEGGLQLAPPCQISLLLLKQYGFGATKHVSIWNFWYKWQIRWAILTKFGMEEQT